MPESILPYGHQAIDDDDVQAVVRTLTAEFITTGPEIGAFESDLAATTRAPHARRVRGR